MRECHTEKASSTFQMGVISREVLKTDKVTVMMDSLSTQMDPSNEDKSNYQNSMGKESSNTQKITFSTRVSGKTINLMDMVNKCIPKTVITKASLKMAKSTEITANSCGITVKDTLEHFKMDLCRDMAR